MAIFIEEKSDFSIHNLPFGIFSHAGGEPQVGIAIGEQVYNLTKAVRKGFYANVALASVSGGVLNDFISLGKQVTSNVRLNLQKKILDGDGLDDFLVPMHEVTMHLPVRVGDYTDFYSSLEHATNVGKLYRDPENALLPNWRHIPVGYHGRASSVVVSGTAVQRPHGQVKPKAALQPHFTATKALDFELETGFIVGKDSKLGRPVEVDEAEDYIFGMVLLNDWSARDIQKWEYAPLGPFLGKNFATSISPWVVTYEALEPFRVAGPVQKPQVMSYLKSGKERNIDLNLNVKINETEVTASNFRYMYWNMEQQLAHHTVNGCNVKVGDLMGSGTISGQDPKSYGSLLEISQGGKKPFLMDDGSKRTFLEDGDEVVLSGYCEKDGVRVGFGELSGKIIG